MINQWEDFKVTWSIATTWWENISMTRCSWNLHNPRTRSEAARRLVSTSKIIQLDGYPFQHKACRTQHYTASRCCKLKFFSVPEPSMSLLIYSSGLSSKISSSSSEFGKKENFIIINSQYVVSLQGHFFYGNWTQHAYNLFKRDHYESKQLAGIIYNQYFLELMMFSLHVYLKYHNKTKGTVKAI